MTAGRAGSFDLQAGWQDRDFGSNGFYAAYNPDQWEHTATALASLRWLKNVGRFALGAAVSYRKNFDRYDWTRGTALNRHMTDNAGAKALGRFRLVGGYDDRGRRLRLQPHLQHQPRGSSSPVPRPLHHAKARHTGNVWLRHATLGAFRRLGFGGRSSRPTGRRRCGASRRAMRRAGWRLEAGRGSRCAADLTGPLLHLPGADQQPRSDAGTAGTYRAFGRDLKPLLEPLGAELLPPRARHHRRWVWYADSDRSPAWRASGTSEQTSRLNTFGAEFRGRSIRRAEKGFCDA